MANDTRILTKTLNNSKPIEDHIREFNLEIQNATHEGWQAESTYNIIDDQFHKCQVIIQQLTRIGNPVQPPMMPNQPYSPYQPFQLQDVQNGVPPLQPPFISTTS